MTPMPGQPCVYDTDEMILAQYGEVLRQLVVERTGSDVELLEGTGIEREMLTDPDQGLTYAQYMTLARNALRVTGDPALGLEYGLKLTPLSHGALGQATLSAPSIRAALQLLERYYHTRLSPVTFRFLEDDTDAIIQIDVQLDLGDLTPFLIETLFGTLLAVNRMLFGDTLTRQGRCLLSYPEPSYGDRYRKFGKVEFGTGVNQLRFRKEFLDLPMIMANEAMKNIAIQQCEEALKAVEARHRSPLVARIKAVIEQSETLPTMEEFASKLGITDRTLRRQLQQHGLTWQGLIADYRHTKACQLLRETDKPVDIIAWTLGYSDPSNFGRAFRKWEGMSPKAYRQQARQAQSDAGNASA
ncbi:MAG: AraC family transcriptional regulator [Gammaproteobacteria bacterium]|nr:MAG: AraC family transcriptional regulator [Gammaproteobacteria bacterium]